MKIVTIIGTRPQYVKLKPWYDFLKEQDCTHIVVDTNQHFTKNVSSVFVDEFDLKIDFNLSVENTDSTDFIVKSMQSLRPFLLSNNPDIVVVMGDTNTTLASALAAHKLEFKVAHIESGMRCWSRERPEEINRIVTDNLSDIHFTSRRQDDVNVENPVYAGDLEYVLLHKMEEEGTIPTPAYEDFILMTIHRNENTTVNRISEIFDNCQKSEHKFIFPIHHRTKQIVDKEGISVPGNVELIDPVGYFEITRLLATCRGIFSDSGGLAKVAPFFGKKCLVPSSYTEYDDLPPLGYIKLGLDMKWLNDAAIRRDRSIYYLDNACEIMYNFIKEYKEKT
jgi:UDP-GlcNAc3NAcA epimerase